MNETIEKLKSEIFRQLNIVDVAPETFGAEEPLFGEGLGLDSIDSLELIVMLERNYGIKIEHPEEGKQIFSSLKTLADYVDSHRKN